MILASESFVSISLSIAAALAYALLATRVKASHSAHRTMALIAAAWLLHGIALGMNMTEQPPRFGFATALSATAWLVAALYVIETRIYPQLPMKWLFAGFSSCAILLSLIYPGTPLTSTSASPWLLLHLILGVASYGLFAVATLHAWFIGNLESRIRLGQDTGEGMPLLTLERLTYRFVFLGFLLLSATLGIGTLFGDHIYGTTAQYKFFNHKTVFSALSWLIFFALQVARHIAGWRGKKAARMIYAGGAFLLLAYVGSHFVLEVILRR